MPSLPLYLNDHMTSASHSLFGLQLRGVRYRAALPPDSLFRPSPAALRRTSFLLTPNPIRLFRATVQPRSGSRSQSEMEEVVNYTFGPYKIHRTEVFHSTVHSFATVNLRPLLPGHILSTKALIHLIDVLVCPRREVKCFIDLTADVVCDLWLTAKEVGGRLERHLEASSLRFAIQALKFELDRERRDRTPEEMDLEADEYRALFS